VTRVAPHTISGASLNASPKEILFLLPSAAPGLCQTDKAPPALVTFPSCDLVALLDMPSGKSKIRSIFVSRGRPQQAPSRNVRWTCTPSSASDAGAETDDAGAVANAGGLCAGESDAGTGSGLGVGAMVLRPDRPRVYVGASAADDFLTALDVVDEAFVIPPGGGRIALEPGAIGIDHLRLSSIPSGLKTRPSLWPTAARSTARAVFSRTGGEISFTPLRATAQSAW